jgi:mono/diheme cytochrome c family protein
MGVMSPRVPVVAAACLMVAAACTAPADRLARGPGVAGQCPEPRATPRAPDSHYRLANPLPATAENLEQGRLVYLRDAEPASCAGCHGVNGDGTGPAGRGLAPPPRNFTCAETMSEIPDGQLYWVLQHGAGEYHGPPTQGAQQIERPGRGSPFGGMRGQDRLSDGEIWQVVTYIRSLARSDADRRDAPADRPAESP